MKTLLTSVFLSFLFFSLIGQNIPEQWRITEEGRYMIMGDRTTNGLYNETALEEIRIYFSQPNYWNLLTQNYNSKTDIIAKFRYKNTDYDSVGVRFKGQTSYFLNNTQKKSFNISMDYVRDKQKLEGYKTLNLNNSWQDPAFMREVLYYRLIRKHSPAAKANFVRLYINDQDWGIYQNVQQLNKDFLEEWYESNDGVNFRADIPDGGSTGPGGSPGMWGDGTAALNFLGTDTAQYQKYYTLKSSDQPDPWHRLIRACAALNQTPVANMENVAPLYFDVDKILWHLACEIAFSDDDSYVYKGKMDYYAYQDAETERFATYDYDANSVMKSQNVNWSAFYNEQKINYPLLNKLLAVPAYRQRYLAHLRTIIRTLLDEQQVNNLIDNYDALIRTSVFADTKKTTSNNAYVNELSVLKNFVRNRKNALMSNFEVNVTTPQISDAAYLVNNNAWCKVQENEAVTVTAKVNYGAGIKKVIIHYSSDFSGLFETQEMNDAGTDGDKTENDGFYSAVLPGFSAGSLVRFYIEAIADNNQSTRTYFPEGAEHELMIFKVEPAIAVSTSIVINEFMASNTGIVKDEFGDNDDWIELYNTTSQSIDMSGFYISDKTDNPTKFKFADGISIPAGGYLIVWADENGTQGPLHANFKLSAEGESIVLSDNNGTILDMVNFGPQITNKSAARIPNGTGPFVIGDHTFNANNEGTSSTEDKIISDGLMIFPNPASDLVYIKAFLMQADIYEIYDMTGNKAMSGPLYDSVPVDISVLSPGMYVVRCRSLLGKIAVVK
jgi:hypothetical protein